MPERTPLTARNRRWESAASFDEAVRVLAANLRPLLDGLDRRPVLFTSARGGEGTTTVCGRLGETLAARGLRVVIVDLSLRAPAAHRLAGVGRDPGLTDVVEGRAGMASSLARVPLPEPAGVEHRGLFVLPAGTAVDDPDELLGRPRTARVLDRLAADADVVLVDGPPVLPVADALTIGRFVGGAVLVVDPRRTGAGSLQRARDLLERNHTKLLGLVLNRVRGTDAAAGDEYGISGPPEDR